MYFKPHNYFNPPLFHNIFKRTNLAKNVTFYKIYYSAAHSILHMQIIA